MVKPTQVNTSVLGMASNVFVALCNTLVTVALQSNTLIHKLFSTALHGVSAAEYLAAAAEKRAEIYGDGMVANGELAEREIQLKHKLRLHNLEVQEAAVMSAEKPDILRPKSEAKAKAKAKAPKPKPTNAAD